MRVEPLRACLALCAMGTLAATAHADQRVLGPDDYYRLLNVTDPQVSPDGAAVAYVVTTNERETDEARGAIWLTNWEGSEHQQLTRAESATQPRFSPDGRYLSFLSARPVDSKAQIWLLDRHGGEARQLTHASGEITSYAWAPDGNQLVLVMREYEDGISADGKPGSGTAKVPKPIVIDAFHFKADGQGYLTASSRTHLYLVEVASGTLTALTIEPEYNDDVPAWSPDGKLLAYVSNHGSDAEHSGVDEIYLVEARVGATPRKLAAAYSPNQQGLAFSPDGQLISFLLGYEPKFTAYITDRLAVVSVGSGVVRILTDGLDRAVSSPVFSADGSSIEFIVEDDGSNYPARIKLARGEPERLVAGTVAVRAEASAAGHTAVLASSDTQASEIFALEGGRLRKLSAHNDALLAELKLSAVEDIGFKSKDGTQIHGQIVKPPSYTPDRKYPTILWIHGGPNGQDMHELVPEAYSPPLERQLLAAQGYVVLALNYRGSSGRGAQFARSIAADWGHKEIEDLLAGVDYAIARGITDPTRLGIGGWSYGAILTNYAIASDTRFKAAISGAGSADFIGMYGVDQWALQWNSELGPPWKKSALYLKLSYPFFHSDRIHTPTLFMGGDQDFNVPIAGGEQMYLALRTLGVPTQLIIYPGQYHDFTRPSYLKDRAERYLAWFAKYLPASP